MSSGPTVGPSLGAIEEAPSVVLTNIFDVVLQEVDELSVIVEHKFTTVVLSDVDFETVCDGESVMSGADFMASPLSQFLELTDLADQHFLLHPACCDLFVCL